jgi:alpha-glucosidase
VYLPKGTWYNFWTNKVYAGGKEILADADLDEIPLYVRQGAVIPLYPVMQYVGEKNIDQLTLHAYYGGENINSYLYEDEGDGYENEKGIYNRKRFKTNSTPTTYRIALKSNGHYEPTYSTYKIIVHGLPFVPSRIMVNEKDVEPAGIVFENHSLIINTDRTSFISLDISQ